MRFSKPSQVFILAAVAVVLCDLVTKEFAFLLFPGESALSGINMPGLGLLPLLNEGAAGGVHLGQHTRLINIASMAVVAALCVLASRQLSLVHQPAPVALGLITGAALGNTLSLLIRPGVIDFISLSAGTGALVFNVADIAVFVGVAALFPVALALAARIMSGRRRAMRARERVVVPQIRRGLVDREVPIAIASEIAIEPEVRDRLEKERGPRIDVVIGGSVADVPDEGQLSA